MNVKRWTLGGSLVFKFDLILVTLEAQVQLRAAADVFWKNGHFRSALEKVSLNCLSIRIAAWALLTRGRGLCNLLEAPFYISFSNR